MPRCLRTSSLLLTLALLVSSLGIPALSAQAVAGAPTSSASADLSHSRTAARGPWMPPTGPIFNDPVGVRDNQVNLTRRVIASVNHAPKGSTIRFAIYSFDLPSVAGPLIRAHKRGVNVQIVLNDNWTSSETVRLRRELGSRVRRKSFIRICYQSCRGGAGNVHLKVYAFSQTGGARNVVMTGSANLTERAQSLQWNDMYTFVGEKVMFDTFVKFFNQMKWDRKVKPQWMSFRSGDLAGQYYRPQRGRSGENFTLVNPFTDEPTDQPVTGSDSPLAAAASSAPGSAAARRILVKPSRDPVMKRLNQVKCKAPKGYGTAAGRTKIRVMMYAWSGERGKYLAEKMAQLKRQGCDITAILSLGGGWVIKILLAAGIPLRSADYRYDELEVVDFYSHLKSMTINGSYEGRGQRILWTGSENWSGMAFRNDELTMEIRRDQAVRLYNRQFGYMWNNKVHAIYGKPTTYPPATAPAPQRY